MKRKTTLLLRAAAILLMPLLVYLCAISQRKYYLGALLIIALTMALFFLSFERRVPQARELSLLAVMCALAVASRVVVPFPSFKPTMAFILLAGIAFGGERGFLCGVVTALVSNFFFSQGPWTPWQMMGYGMGGLAAGLLQHARLLKRQIKSIKDIAILSAVGFVLIVLLVGPILDTSTYLTVSMKSAGGTAALPIYITGLLTANIPHGIATAVTLALAGKPLLKMLERVQVKYGLLQD